MESFAIVAEVTETCWGRQNAEAEPFNFSCHPLVSVLSLLLFRLLKEQPGFSFCSSDCSHESVRSSVPAASLRWGWLILHFPLFSLCFLPVWASCNCLWAFFCGSVSPACVVSGSLLPKALWQFGKVIECAQPGVSSLKYNDYGCWCGFGGTGTPLDELDEYEEDFLFSSISRNNLFKTGSQRFHQTCTSISCRCCRVHDKCYERSRKTPGCTGLADLPYIIDYDYTCSNQQVTCSGKNEPWQQLPHFSLKTLSALHSNFLPWFVKKNWVRILTLPLH